MLNLLGWVLLIVTFIPCMWLVINGCYCALTSIGRLSAAPSEPGGTPANRPSDTAFVFLGSLAIAAIQLLIGIGIPYLILRFMIGMEIVTADELSGLPR